MYLILAQSALPEAAGAEIFPLPGAGGRCSAELRTHCCVLGSYLASPMFCFCWQNSLLKLQALETDLCSAFLANQEEAAQVHGLKDPTPVSTQSVPVEGADAAGKRLGWGQFFTCTVRIVQLLAALLNLASYGETMSGATEKLKRCLSCSGGAEREQEALRCVLV